jgi:uncharacterized membrane protein
LELSGLAFAIVFANHEGRRFMTRRSRTSQRGQVVTMLAASVPLMFGLLGLVVHQGWNYWRSESCKTAAQAAAFAAARQAQLASSLRCGEGVMCQGQPADCPSTLPAVPKNNLLAGCNYAGANGFTSAPGRSVQYQAGVGNSPVRGSSPSYWVRFTISERGSSFLSNVLGEKFANARASSTAAVFAGTAAEGSRASLIE